MNKHENGQKAIFYLHSMNKLSEPLKITGLTSKKEPNSARKALQLALHCAADTIRYVRYILLLKR